ncbi:TetR/AcrR family transcriptional regulator [Jiangella aurantiaca]|uniref:TetR/AcrR family transcriptional regulator n=1 Tax=Jiangella aurantiaca TaxID=2530373 RepID=A0A4R5AIY8_9ACTN|nr:TetR/AcrR family transcriptional regulator [Jiangella aurantiaca]TDD72603.1 TetR/AcrR family transcriptional regulator [Jiangella aurantiaca]
MTNSVIARAGKRERLVASARELFHHQGVERTTLADIAHAAEVPLGNVYYYFKAKDDIIRAVIDAQAEEIRTRLRALDQHPTAPERLVAFTHQFAQQADMVASHGCPHGGLCAQLDKRRDGMEKAASVLMSLQIDWAYEQFRLLGREDAQSLAMTLVAGYQGAALLANALQDPTVVTDQARQLRLWIEHLADERGDA